MLSIARVLAPLSLGGCSESLAHKRLFNLLPQFSRLGTQGPASLYKGSMLLSVFRVWCVLGWMFEGSSFSSFSLATSHMTRHHMHSMYSNRFTHTFVESHEVYKSLHNLR